MTGALAALAVCAGAPARSGVRALVLATRGKPLRVVDGLRFGDLNGNGRLDVYEDWRLPMDRRVENLLSKLTLEEAKRARKSNLPHDRVAPLYPFG